MIVALVLAALVAVVAVVTAQRQPGRSLTLEQQYRFDVTLAPLLAEAKVSIRRELDRSIWGTGPAKPFTGLQSLLGVPVIVDPSLPPGTIYMYNPDTFRHFPVSVDR